ncbi:MAG: HAD family hydrolase, partial [Stenotrophomonas sp.]
DVAGAMRAGLRGCWINREEHSWTHTELQPDLQFDTLTGLADWLDGNASNPQR